MREQEELAKDKERYKKRQQDFNFFKIKRRHSESIQPTNQSINQPHLIQPILLML
jgi:hypothetical protein